jgi:hypothetical protein
MKSVIVMWNIKVGMLDAYRDFIQTQYMPVLSSIGLSRQNVLYRIVGGGPEVLAVLSAASEAELSRALESAEWHSLRTELAHYITDFSQRLVSVPPMARL